MNIQLTKSFEPFDALNTPSCDISFVGDNIRFPRLLQFNRTYYKKIGNKLTAFRILAYAIYSKLTTYEKVCLTYLVQLPNEDPQWEEDFIDQNTCVFNSKEDFMRHQITPCNINFDWQCGRIVFPTLARAAVIGFYGLCYSWSNSQNRPTNDFYPTFTRFMVVQNTLFVHIRKNTCGRDGEVFLTKEECVASRLDGMEIVEFCDEPIDLNITILPNKKVTHTLHFVED